MTSHRDSHGTTDIKPEMLSGVQTGNGTPYDKYNIHSIAPACTNRKDDIFMQRQLVQNFTYIYWSGGKGHVHWLSTHGGGHILICGVFSTFFKVPHGMAAENKNLFKESWALGVTLCPH